MAISLWRKVSKMTQLLTGNDLMPENWPQWCHENPTFGGEEKTFKTSHANPFGNESLKRACDSCRLYFLKFRTIYRLIKRGNRNNTGNRWRNKIWPRLTEMADRDFPLNYHKDPWGMNQVTSYSFQPRWIPLHHKFFLHLIRK